MLACVMAPAPAASDTTPQWQSLDRLAVIAQETVRTAAPADGYRREFAAQALDPRLKLRACEHPEASMHDPGNRPQLVHTVAINCDAPHWTVYVRVSVEVYGDVVVARRPLVRGHLVQADDVYRDERRLDRLPYGWFDTAADVLGRPLKRGVSAGGVVTPGVVGVAHEITNGQEVLLKARTGGVDVAMAGEALEHGQRGDVIRVRNLRSGTVVEGIVRSPRVVEVLLD